MDKKYREVNKRAKNLLKSDPELVKYLVQIGKLTGDSLGQELMDKIMELPDCLKDIDPEAFNYLEKGWVPEKTGNIIRLRKGRNTWNFHIPYSKEKLEALKKYTGIGAVNG